jgi:mRNA-degrading endonuclease RelE of RelBE toxin-antitoxin system
VAKKILWSDQAKADVRAIDRETALDLLQRLARFLSTEQGDIRRLQDIDPPEFRLRLGDYRLRYYDHGDSIELLRVLHRKDAYRR